MFVESINPSPETTRHASVPPGRLTVATYSIAVTLVTAAGVAMMMMFRPSFAHSVKWLLGLEQTIIAPPDSFYAVRVAPILETHCTSCHGATRQKGDLRLDSVSAMQRGGRHGSVATPGDPKHSELLFRMKLPSMHPKAMPPEGKAPLLADEITIVQLWIEAGASPVLPLAAIEDAPPPPRRIEFPKIDPAAVAKARAPLAPVVERLQQQYPEIISYESRGSDSLEINASRLGRSFDDEVLKSFAPLAAKVVRADLSGTAITDASATLIGQMTRLQLLYLQSTRVTSLTIEEVASLPKLRVLTVFDTAVADTVVLAACRPGLSIYGNEACTCR